MYRPTLPRLGLCMPILYAKNNTDTGLPCVDPNANNKKMGQQMVYQTINVEKFNM